ncbi:MULTISPECIES: ferritin-like domain-containing protein [unclassified Pseudonocardia]|uniref:ferritin-like domain-containing protein n=1 Tax=unclassified Pseudonocardia TaxID=2619320 RepID=UPI0009597BD0|nr:MULTISPECIES: ferritin-like domain-containing protein [unclassified Pseudonocardia]OJY40978.1 MAG: hypothetical protein BGP03_25555 [Pseudonocardia sp. 73-21]
MAETRTPQSLNTATLITQLRALERLTRTEVKVGRVRVTQARTDAVRRELEQNADNGVRRTQRIVAQLQALDAVPDVVSPAVSAVVALFTSTLEQSQPVEEALFNDLALEHQLLDRARYVRTVAEHVGRGDVRRLADDLVTAHTATVEWITTVLAEEALGGPSALRPTPLQRVAGGVSRAASLPTRVAVAGFNRAVHTVVRTGESARSTVEDVAGTVTRIGEGTREVAVAGRNAALRRAEQVANRDGADDVAGAVHGTRRNLGTLTVEELPIANYEELTVQNAIAAIRELSEPDDINAVLAFEEKHKDRTGVVSAAQTRYAAVAKDAAGIDR